MKILSFIKFQPTKLFTGIAQKVRKNGKKEGIEFCLNDDGSVLNITFKMVKK